MSKLSFLYSSLITQTLFQFLLTKLHICHFLSAQIHHLIETGQVQINHQTIQNSDAVLTPNAKITLKVTKWPKSKPEWAITIHHLDNFLLIIEKPTGITTHTDAHHLTRTVAQQVAPFIKFNTFTSQLHPGIVHRLDKLTSGLLIIARTKKVMTILQLKMAERKIKRYYWAIAQNQFTQAKLIVQAPIAKIPFQHQMKIVGYGKMAETTFQPLTRLKNSHLIKCQLKTGRTHQIRVHLQYIKHPIVNDPLYNLNVLPTKFIFLHAYQLQFQHPFFNRTRCTFTTLMPNSFCEFIKSNI